MSKDFKILKGPTKEEQDIAFKYLPLGKMLCLAAEYGSLKYVKIALSKDIDPAINIDQPLRGAARNGHVKIVKLLLNHGANVHVINDWPLRLAVEKGHLKVVQLLLDRGADIHIFDDWCLKIATINNYKDLVELLLRKGANMYTGGADSILRWWITKMDFLGSDFLEINKIFKKYMKK